MYTNLSYNACNVDNGAICHFLLHHVSSRCLWHQEGALWVGKNPCVLLCGPRVGENPTLWSHSQIRIQNLGYCRQSTKNLRTFKFTLMTSSSDSSLWLRNGEGLIIPAPLTATLRGGPRLENIFGMASITDFTCSEEVTSTSTGQKVVSLCPWLLAISCRLSTVSSTSDRMFPATATEAPSFANNWHTARPIPLPPPENEGA